MEVQTPKYAAVARSTRSLSASHCLTLCGDWHFNAKRRSLIFLCSWNARSLTPFEMTNHSDGEYSHALPFATTALKDCHFEGSEKSIRL